MPMGICDGPCLPRKVGLRTGHNRLVRTSKEGNDRTSAIVAKRSSGAGDRDDRVKPKESHRRDLALERKRAYAP
jgi:hypothetical protein